MLQESSGSAGGKIPGIVDRHRLNRPDRRVVISLDNIRMVFSGT